jgi:hypothetical protein
MTNFRVCIEYLKDAYIIILKQGIFHEK